jgi:hypothetical protein
MVTRLTRRIAREERYEKETWRVCPLSLIDLRFAIIVPSDLNCPGCQGRRTTCRPLPGLGLSTSLRARKLCFGHRLAWT